jgi:hypothetical protein
MSKPLTILQIMASLFRTFTTSSHCNMTISHSQAQSLGLSLEHSPLLASRSRTSASLALNILN